MAAILQIRLLRWRRTRIVERLILTGRFGHGFVRMAWGGQYKLISTDAPIDGGSTPFALRPDRTAMTRRDRCSLSIGHPWPVAAIVRLGGA